ncbi:MAG: hypothetical protein JEZ07_09865 [Phycisphaerae bacterium]|nr:hypothetical protein [Phycisphaerae bacterium]
MKTRVFLLPALLCGCFLLGGCNRGDFTVLTTKNIPLNNFTCDSGKSGLCTEGHDTNHIIIFFSTKPYLHFEESIDDALKNGNADILTNARLTQTAFYIPYIYGICDLKTTGTAVKF